MRTALLCVLPFFPLNAFAEATDPFAEERLAMVREQIENRGVKDPRVLAAMRKIPRHLFVPEDVRRHAYKDGPLPIGEGQTISQPYIVAVMTELLAIGENDKVLEIGTGSGYQAAVLAELTPNVYSIEIFSTLAARAKQVLERAGYDRLHLKTGDGYAGWAEYEPYDAIIVTCSPEAVPPALTKQLKEGGRMVIPVGDWPKQTLYVIRKTKGKLTHDPIFPVSFVPMLDRPQSR